MLNKIANAVAVLGVGLSFLTFNPTANASTTGYKQGTPSFIQGKWAANKHKGPWRQITFKGKYISLGAMGQTGIEIHNATYKQLSQSKYLIKGWYHKPASYGIGGMFNSFENHILVIKSGNKIKLVEKSVGYDNWFTRGSVAKDWAQ